MNYCTFISSRINFCLHQHRERLRLLSINEMHDVSMCVCAARVREAQQCLNDLTAIIIVLISAFSAMGHLKCGKQNRGKGVATLSLIHISEPTRPP